AALRVHVALRSTPRIVLHRHPGRKCHRFFAVAPHVELVDRGFFVHQLAALLQRGAVEGDDLGERGVRAEEVIPLVASGVVRGDDLRAPVDWHAEDLLVRRTFLGRGRGGGGSTARRRRGTCGRRRGRTLGFTGTREGCRRL